MDDRDISFMKHWFSEYYRQRPVELPSRFGRREFGFIMFDGGFFNRHIAFKTRKELDRYMRTRVPRHAYYSTAYYNNPSASKMADKGWMGADLIFDLDADHIKGSEGMSYPQMLEAVKKQFIKLVDEFLNQDFGFDYRDIKIVFSGGRGYHAHISEERVARLQSHERREIVDYITGVGLKLDHILEKDAVEISSYKEHRKIIERYRLPSKNSGGWKGKVARAIEPFIIEMKEMGEKEWVNLMLRLVEETGKEQIEREIGVKNMGKGTFRAIYQEIFESNKYERILKEGTLNVFKSEKRKELFLYLVMRKLVVSLEGETDEPVTSDIKRLIRLPGSLHGKSALMVMELTREGLPDFKPVVDGIPEIFKDGKIKVFLPAKTTLPIGEDAGKEIDAGEQKVPPYLALFLVGSGKASTAMATNKT